MHFLERRPQLSSFPMSAHCESDFLHNRRLVVRRSVISQNKQVVCVCVCVWSAPVAAPFFLSARWLSPSLPGDERSRLEAHGSLSGNRNHRRDETRRDRIAWKRKGRLMTVHKATEPPRTSCGVASLGTCGVSVQFPVAGQNLSLNLLSRDFLMK